MGSHSTSRPSGSLQKKSWMWDIKGMNWNSKTLVDYLRVYKLGVLLMILYILFNCKLVKSAASSWS